MNKIKHVLVFEYMQVVKSKSFIITTIFLSAILLCIGVIPAIFMGAVGKLINEESRYAGYIDSTGEYSNELLAEYFPEYQWVKHNISELDILKDKVDNKDYKIGLKINDNVSYDLILRGSLYASDGSSYDNMMKEVYQKKILSNKFTANETNELLNVEITSGMIVLGKNGMTGFWLAYVTLILTFILLVSYGKTIGTSVVNEKTSRTVEIIFTSAKPTDIIFGKVFGVGLAVFTQCIILICAFSLSMALSKNTMFSDIYAIVYTLLTERHLYFYALLFFIFGFFSYSFLYAAAGATAKEAQDINKTSAIPVTLMLIGFYVSMFYIASAERFGEGIIRVLSFTPFLSPFIIIVRMCTAELKSYEIVIAILINIVTIIFSGIISAKIYKTYIMMYGLKPSLKKLFAKR